MVSLAGVGFINDVGAAEPASGQDVEAGKRISDQDRLLEKEKRLLLRTSDDLKSLIQVCDREVAELEREIDSIALLESSVRENDLSIFMEWYRGITGWAKEMTAGLEGDLSLISSGKGLTEGVWQVRYADMAAAFRKFGKQAAGMVKRFDAEGNRLAKVIDRRRLLQAKLGDMEERLKQIELRLADKPGGTGRETKDADRLRIDIRMTQSELLNLSQVDEDILQHYLNLSERASGEADWMQAKSDEYALLSDIAIVVSGSDKRSRTLESAMGQVRRVYEREIERMKRKIVTLERKRSNVAPAGTLREVERSADLNALYAEQKRRYEDYISRLKIQISAWEAELSELQ
jgi:hypothetical protein